MNMTIKCPTCRRKNSRGSAECSRCGMNLAKLWQIVDHAELWYQYGLAALAQQRFVEAVGCLRYSYQLYHRQQTARFLVIAENMSKSLTFSPVADCVE